MAQVLLLVDASWCFKVRFLPPRINSEDLLFVCLVRVVLLSGL